MERTYRNFSYKEANIRYASQFPETVEKTVRRWRNRLDEYIRFHPIFRTSLVPVELTPEAPEPALRMHRASLITGTGPMAAVAGTMAQLAAEAAADAGDDDVIIENGGGHIPYMPLPGDTGSVRRREFRRRETVPED